MPRSNPEDAAMDYQALAKMSRLRFTVTICALLTTTLLAGMTAFFLTLEENQHLLEKIIKTQKNITRKCSGE